MAINKKLIHFNNFSTFNSKKLSANVENTQYTVGVEGEVQSGAPDILYQSICWIKDTKQQWTHGQLYNLDSLTEEDVKTINGQSVIGEGNIQTAVAYAEYSGTSTDVVVTTIYGHFPEELTSGARVSVKIENSITSIATLNVNGTGAKKVYYKGSSLASGTINRYNTYDFVYDGSFYRVIGINTDTDTHYTAKNVVTSSASSKSNATSSNGSVYLNVIENSTVRSSHKITGSGGTLVTSDGSGNITIDTSLKTINGESLIGDGNLIIGGSNSDANVQAIDINEVLDDVETNTYIKYVPQTLTEEQKAQARANIGVGTGSTGGSTSSSGITEQTILSWGFTKNTGTYSKPSGGIPKSDLASSVQTSLAKADTALQSYTEQYQGTITGITMNGSSKGTSGVIDLGTVITEHQNIDGKQDQLVSGTNIKTINGTSILGSGDISIGEGSGSNTKWNPEYVGDYTGTSISLDPNKLYYGAAFSNDITINFNWEGSYNEWRIIFYIEPNTSLSTQVDLWANGKIPDISAGGYFELSVVDDNRGVMLGVLAEFKEL